MCTDLGRPANHRAGNKACLSAFTKRRMGPPPKPSKTNTQEEPKTAETATNREDLNNVEMTHIAEQPKPQRVRSRLPRLKEVELVDRPAAEILSEPKQREEGKSQDTRDREKRAVKIQKAKRVTGRHTESEEEDDEQMCEPEDSRHDEPKD